MKKLILSTVFIFALFSLYAQSSFNEAIQQGNDALKRENYTAAIKKYLIAETFDQDKWKIVQEKLDSVYSIVDNKQEELKRITAELKMVTVQKEELEHVLLFVKEDVTQMKQRFEDVRLQVQALLKAMNSIIIQTDGLENKLLQMK